MFVVYQYSSIIVATAEKHGADLPPRQLIDSTPGLIQRTLFTPLLPYFVRHVKLLALRLNVERTKRS